MFHYTIRPDGSIRKVSQRQTPVKDPDVHITSPTFYAPAQYRYNHQTSQFGEIDLQVIADRRGQQAAAAAQVVADNQARHQSMRSKLNMLDPNTKEMFELLLEELGINL